MLLPMGNVMDKGLLMLSSHLPLTALPHVPAVWEMGGDKIIPFIPAFHGSDLWGRNPSVSELLKFGAAGRACGPEGAEL